METLGVIAESRGQQISITANIGYRHGESLLPWIERVCGDLSFSPKDSDMIVCTIGPGSFTGLRIGLATAKGMSSAAGCPVAGVPTLDFYSAGFSFFPGMVIPVIDARKKQFYTAMYHQGQRQSDYLDITAEELAALADGKTPALFCGPDAAALLPVIEQHYSRDTASEKTGITASSFKKGLITIFPSGADLFHLIRLGKNILGTEGPLDPSAGPIYLRRSEAEIHHENMQAKKQTDT